MTGWSRRFLLAVLACLLACGSDAGRVAWAQASPPLAIKGYDPVAYFTLGKPEKGSPGLEYVWDEQRYRFARQEHLAQFKADPFRYAPQFANYCAMALTRGEVHEANPEYWLVWEGKLYLFGASYGPSRFMEAANLNKKLAERNRPLVDKR